METEVCAGGTGTCPDPRQQSQPRYLDPAGLSVRRQSRDVIGSRIVLVVPGMRGQGADLSVTRPRPCHGLCPLGGGGLAVPSVCSQRRASMSN